MCFIDRESANSYSQNTLLRTLLTLLIPLLNLQASHAQHIIDDLFFAKEFCDEPSLDPSVEAGMFIWQDCDTATAGLRELWYIKITAGGDSVNQTYTGNIQSNLEFDHLQTLNLEAPDFLLHDNGFVPYLINLQSSVIDNDTDSFSFTIHKHSTLALLSINESDSLKIYAGADKIEVLAPVDLTRPPISALPAITVTDAVVNEEEQMAEFTLFLSRPPGPNNAVTLNVRTQDGSAVGNTDYFPVNTNVTFNSEEVIKKIRVNLIDDCQAEPVENFELVIDDIIGATLNNTVLTATIADSDDSYSILELEEYGYISIAQFSDGQPNGQTAKPNDGIDDTQAIQAAMDAAITTGKSVYFPQGDWQVSDTITGMMTVSEVTPGKWKQDNRQHASSLIGSVCDGNRPKIILKPTDDSFNNPASNFSRKPVIWLYSQKT